MRIDAHRHYWQINGFDYAWIEHGSPLYRDFLPSRSDIPCIVIESANTAEENAFLYGLSQMYPHIRGIVGYAEHPKELSCCLGWEVFKGIRINLLKPATDLSAIVQMLEQNRLTCDILMTPEQTPEVIALARTFKDLSLILNHFAGAGTNHKALGKIIDVFSPFSNIYMKFSLQEGCPPLPMFRRIIERWGVKRLLFGSNYPVCKDTHVLESYLGSLAASECDAINWRTANQVYNLGINDEIST